MTQIFSLFAFPICFIHLIISCMPRILSFDNLRSQLVEVTMKSIIYYHSKYFNCLKWTLNSSLSYGMSSLSIIWELIQLLINWSFETLGCQKPHQLLKYTKFFSNKKWELVSCFMDNKNSTNISLFSVVHQFLNLC